MPDSLSDAKKVNNAALDCPTAPSGGKKLGKRFLRVQAALLRSKRAESVTEGIRSKPKLHSSVINY